MPVCVGLPFLIWCRTKFYLKKKCLKMSLTLVNCFYSILNLLAVALYFNNNHISYFMKSGKSKKYIYLFKKSKLNKTKIQKVGIKKSPYIIFVIK